MKRSVTLDGWPGELELESDGGQFRITYRRSHSEIRRKASVIECEPGIYSILVNGRSYEAKVVSRGGAVEVDIDGQRVMVEVRDPRALSKRGGAGTGEGRQNISAPMPGKVVRVLVEVGTEVEAGAGLIVVEAMKMQNEMKAPKAGRVATVTVQAGETVSAGQVLVTIE